MIKRIASLTLYNPSYGLAVIVVLAIFAAFCAWVLPFYRKELRVEDVTRSTPLDGLRGILCFAVMCHHAVIMHEYMSTGKWLAPTSNVYRLLGSNSVALFFAVTAFLFWSRILKFSGKMETWPFLRARWFRIVPLYLFSAALALGIAAHHMQWHAQYVKQDVAYMFVSMGTDGGWGEIGGYKLIYLNAQVTWSLQYEWAFYLTLPALAAVIRGGQSRRLLLLLAALFVLRESHMDAVLYFGIGITAAYACRNPALVRILRSPQVSVVVVLAFILMPLAAHLPADLARLSRMNLPILSQPNVCANLTLLLIAFVPIACGNSLFGVLNFTGLRLMGVVSYSVYLLHGLAIHLCRYKLGSVPGTQVHIAHVFWLREMALSIGVLLFAFCTYRWVEHPFVLLEKRLRKTPASVETGKSIESSSPVPHDTERIPALEREVGG